VGSRVDPELAEALLDQAVVLRLVAGLARQRELHGDLTGRADPGGGAFCGLELVLESEDQETGHREVRARLLRSRRRDAGERLRVLRVELREKAGARRTACVQ
jgi:hypothetical protein